MPQLTDKKKKLFFYLIIFILLSTQIAKKQYIEKKSQTRLNHIEVLGLSIEENIKVSKSLNSLLFKNILFLNKDNFYNILNKNNLIESFSIKKYYIGSNGKLIAVSENNNFNKKLPFVFSKSNYEKFINLKKIIDKSKFKFEEIESFYYFPSNRWDLKTNGGLLIKLPEKNILDSLQYAHVIKTNEQFKDNKIIDLRISNNIIISNE